MPRIASWRQAEYMSKRKLIGLQIMNITEFVVVIIHGSYFNAFIAKSKLERRDQLFSCLK